MVTTLPQRVDRCVQIVLGEYREMPGLRLTKPQVRRFLGIDADTCEAVLDRLEREEILKRTPADLYVLRP
jgi:hypothetical protein